MKTTFKCVCPECDTVCRIVFEQPEPQVEPMFCPFCGVGEEPDDGPDDVTEDE